MNTRADLELLFGVGRVMLSQGLNRSTIIVDESTDGNIKRKITALMSSASVFNLLSGHPQMHVVWD